LVVILCGCSGKLVALSSSDGGPNAMMSGTGNPSGGASGGAATGNNDTPEGAAVIGSPLSDCLTKVLVIYKCGTADTCHGGQHPVNGIDLTPEGVGNGAWMVDRAADDTADGLCGKASQPPLSGFFIVDSHHADKSLLYSKTTDGNWTPGLGLFLPVCGARMPFATTRTLRTAEQQCILDWILTLPGVAPLAEADGGP
jgi:hypothetical protein